MHPLSLHPSPKGTRPAALCIRGVVVVALLLSVRSCSVIEESLTPAPESVSAGASAFGTFRRTHGVGVLTVWGTPYQRGFAHGRLLAPAILDMVDAVCGSSLLLSDVRDYDRVILPLMDRFRFEPDEEAEMRGVFDGVKSKLGKDVMLKKFRRPFTLKDLKAYNTAGDWYRQACASFAAWGSRAKGGHVWVGRNFDFPPAKAFFSHQMILVHRRRGKKKTWATVTAPGMIGCITGINEDGVFVSVHDAFLPLRPLETGYTPRLLVLRRLMETCQPRDLEAQARPLLEARKQMFDSSIFLAAPVNDGTNPALVFEYNNDYSKDKGVTVRKPEDNEKQLSREMIACTNHFRKRTGLRFSLIRYRYPLMRRVLMAKTNRGQKVDFDIGRKTMGAVRLPITIHTVIADLNTLDFWFASGEFLSPPGRRDFVKLPMKAWLTEK